MFVAEAAAIEQAIGEILVAVHHVGSTAVPGLAAKPVIDILLEVSSNEKLDERNPAMAELGYEARGAFGIPGRRYFAKGGDVRSHHVHAFESGHPGLVRHLAFRDYLRAHPAVAAEYGELKCRNALLCAHDNEVYCDLKDAFVGEHERLALAWARR